MCKGVVRRNEETFKGRQAKPVGGEEGEFLFLASCFVQKIVCWKLFSFVTLWHASKKQRE